jgi:hypothetical protein
MNFNNNALPCQGTLNFGEDFKFDFSNVQLGESSSSMSFDDSSYSSSSFGQHTPTTAPSTPSRSIPFNHDTSFVSPMDGLTYELTPPSAATSTYFPSAPRTGDVSEFAHPGFPGTPPRCQLNFPSEPSGSGAHPMPSQTVDSATGSRCQFNLSSEPLGGCGSQATLSHPVDSATPPRCQLSFSNEPFDGRGAQLTPSQSVDFSMCMIGLSIQPLMSTPEGPARTTSDGLPRTDQTSSMWSTFTQPDSPTSCPEQRPAPMLLEPFQPIQTTSREDQTTPLTPMSPPRVPSGSMEGPRSKTTALQEAQERSQPNNPRVRTRRERPPRRDLPPSGSSEIVTATASKHKCPWAGCNRRYRRKEHMKRHIKR